MELSELLVTALAAEERAVRELIPFAINVLESHHLFRTGKVAQRLLVNNASTVYETVITENELRVLQRSLWVLYEYYAVEQPNILPPPQYLPVKRLPPIWNSHNPPLSLCERVIDAAQQGISHPDESIKLPSMLILLARYTAVSRFKALKAVLLSDSITVLKNSGRAFFQNGHDTVFLDAVGLAVLRQLQQSSIIKTFLRQPEKFFEKWVNSHSLWEYQGNWRDLLKTAIFLDSPMYCQTLNPLSKSLPSPLILLALAGISPDIAEQPAPSKYPRSEQIIENTHDESTCLLRIGFRTGEYDIDALRELNFILTKFEQDEPTGLRNSSAFKEAKCSLGILEKNRLKNCSSIVYSIIFYCKNLFLTGSAWKDNLAASSIRNYASTLKVFAQEAWSDNELINAAQSSEAKLFNLTEQVIEAFENISAPDRQNTVSNFCQFLEQRSKLKFFDSNLLDYMGAGASGTRVHYIPPQLFESEMAEFLAQSAAPEKQQTYWFMQICYFLGLRYTEAAHLHIDDVTSEWIYVSRRERRKTLYAIRRISTAFMPAHLYAEFLGWVDSRKVVCDYLFDETVIDFSVIQALQIIRDRCGIPDFVVHSLRHCAANSMLWLISLAVSQRLDWRQRYYFCQASLFDEQNLTRVNRLFRSLGREVSTLIPVLEFVATQLGHSSPAITASSYWHLLSLLSFEQSHLRTLTPDRNVVLQLLADNNYRFAVWPKHAQYDEARIFAHVSRGLTDVQSVCRESDDTDNTSVAQSSVLEFSEYVRLLVEYHTLPSTVINEHLKAHFYQNFRDYDVSFVETVSNQPAWLRILERVNQTQWIQLNRNAVLTTAGISSNPIIHDIRTLQRVLRTLSLLGYQDNSLLIKCSKATDIPQSWLHTLARFKCSIQEHEAKKVTVEIPFLKSKSKKTMLFCQLIPLIKIYLEYCKESLC